MAIYKVKSKRIRNEPVTEALRVKGIERGRKRSEGFAHPINLEYVSGKDAAFKLAFEDQTTISLPVRNYSEFDQLSEEELRRVELTGGGSILHLDEKDLHVSVAGLVEASRSLAQFAIGIATSRIGSVTSKAKAAASRENGLKGGRPRKELQLG